MVVARRYKEALAYLALHAQVFDSENVSDRYMKLLFDLAPRSSRHPTELSGGYGRVAVESVVAPHKLSLGRC